METQNEIKAKEIAQYHCYNELNLIQAYNAALEAMEWKDNWLTGWLDILNKEIDKLTTGNLAHNKTHIKCLLYEIQEQLKGE